ncbi:MAG TPA: alpha/beta hydrolase [Pseudomonadales bacterium]|nr:alpha/beta hydrolase [Pseudomonadales bacterium]
MAAPVTDGFDPDALRRTLPELQAAPDRPVGLEAFTSHYGLLVPADVRHRVGRIGTGDAAVVVHLFLPPAPRGTLLAIHGLFDHAALWRHQIRWALEARLAVCVFDLPGHGLSGGRRAHVTDFADYVQALERVMAVVGDDLPRPLVGLGHSTGCAVLMEAAHEATASTVHFDDLILLAPLVRPAGHRLRRVLLPALSLVRGELPRGDYGNTLDPEFNALRRADPLQPPTLPVDWVRAMVRWGDGFEALPASSASPLVIQGTRDRTLAWRDNLATLERIYAAPRITLLEGAGHNLMNEAASFRIQIERILDERLKGLVRS